MAAYDKAQADVNDTVITSPMDGVVIGEPMKEGETVSQGIFAVESAVNELAGRLGMDPVELRLKNMVREGQTMPAYYGETAKSCALDRCLLRAKEMIGWDEKFPCRDMGNGKVRSVG